MQSNCTETDLLLRDTCGAKLNLSVRLVDNPHPKGAGSPHGDTNNENAGADQLTYHVMYVYLGDGEEKEYGKLFKVYMAQN